MSLASYLARGVCIALIAALAAASPASGSGGDRVIVRSGQHVEIAFTSVTQDGPELEALPSSFRQAIDLAVASNPTVRGFPVRINAVETSCGGDNAAAAGAIVENRQHVGVLGFICSAGAASGLPVLETAGIVSISGSASADWLPELAPSTFNRVIVRDALDVEAWYGQIMSSSVNGAWRAVYQALYGTAPTLFADLYFDAASLLLAKLDSTAEKASGQLVIDRSRLAAAVRRTTRFHGASCVISLERATGNRLVPAAGPCPAG